MMAILFHYLLDYVVLQKNGSGVYRNVWFLRVIMGNEAGILFTTSE